MQNICADFFKIVVANILYEYHQGYGFEIMHLQLSAQNCGQTADREHASATHLGSLVHRAELPNTLSVAIIRSHVGDGTKAVPFPAA
jgi:hypothetical protein